MAVKKKLKTKSVHCTEKEMWIFLFIIIVFGLVFIFLKYPSFVIESENYPLSEGSVIAPVESVYKVLSLVDAKKLFDKNKNNSDFWVIDVSSDYNAGHIINALNYPISDGSFDIVAETFDKEGIYLVYSRNNIDSITAYETLIKNGFKNVYRLRDNYGAWVVAGYPFER